MRGSVQSLIQSVLLSCCSFRDAFLLYIDSQLWLKQLIESRSRGILNHLDMPFDKHAHQSLKISKVLPILVNQVSIAHFPVLVVIHTVLMLRNLCQKFIRQREIKVLLRAELTDDDRDARVHLILQLLNVSHCVVKIGFQARLLDKRAELSDRISKMVNVCGQMPIGLLEQH